MAQILALANQKGGVGKTTTAVNVAHQFALLGYRILLIDLDPQGNTTSSLGVQKSELHYSSYEMLLDADCASSVVLKNVKPDLDLVGASTALSGVEVELVNLHRRERRLHLALQDLSLNYDAIIIDSPPSLGLLTINALTAAREVIVPIQCEYLALEGLMQLIQTMDLVKKRINPELDVLGVVMTMYDARTNLSAQVVENVRRHFPSRLFDTVVPRSVRLAEAPSYGQTIFEYAPRSSGAEAYQALTQEIVHRIGLTDSVFLEDETVLQAADI